jgi:hypothetical protein
MSMRASARFRRLRVVLLVAVAFIAVVGVTVGPSRALAAAGAMTAEPPTQNTPFLPAASPMNITIANLTANQLTVTNNVQITLANGSQVTTTKYTFQKLALNNNTVITTTDGGSTVHLSIPSGGQLGGTDTSGAAETTVMWGNISNLCITVLIQICGIQGLLNFFGSIIPITSGASNFVGTIYAIQTTDNHAALSTSNNPVQLPGSLWVTTP